MRRLSIQLVDGKVTRVIVLDSVANAAMTAFDRYKRRLLFRWRRSIVIKTTALSLCAVDLEHVAVITDEREEQDA